jgi:hypothetical protein
VVVIAKTKTIICAMVMLVTLIIYMEKMMKIAEKLMNGIDIDKEELKFLLWNTLIQLSSYDDDVDCVEEESFSVEQMLSSLDGQLGAHNV